MILRRIKAHVEKENWFAVGIDFAIVIIGVFIGIQVANWNEGRAERARGESIKARLVSEFTEIESELARHVRDVASWQRRADTLATDILTGRIDPKTKAFSDRLFDIHWRPPSGGSNTVEELISQGDLDLVGSPDLVEQLLQFQTLTLRHISASETLVRQLNIYGSQIHQLGILTSIPPELQSDDIKADLAERDSVPDLYVGIMTSSISLQAELEWYRTSLEKACAILQALEEPCRASEALTSEVTP